MTNEVKVEGLDAKVIGFINKSLWTDVNSYAVFEKDGKTYACEVKIIPDKVKPEFVPGGFSVICLNNDEVIANGRIVKKYEESEPFEIECRKGTWGFRVFVSGPCSDVRFKSKEEAEQWVRENGYTGNETSVYCLTYKGKVQYWTVQLYEVTKTGRRKTTFKKLGDRIEPECRFFYDYNF